MSFEPVFNELSLPGAGDKSIGQEQVDLFVCVLALCHSRLRSAKVLHSSVDIWAADLGSGYSLARWANSADRDARVFMASQALKTPLLQSNVEAVNTAFFLTDARIGNLPGNGLRAAWALDSLLVSFQSVLWDSPTVSITVETCTPEERIETGEESVPHVSKVAHIADHADWAQKRYRLISSGPELLSRRAELMPHLRFCPTAEEQLAERLNITSSDFIYWPRVLKQLWRLESAVAEWTDGAFPWSSTFASASVESQSVANNPRLRALREHLCDDGVMRYFSVHLKMAGPNWRIYIHPDDTPGKVWVGYIGPHLPTVKFD